MVTSKICNRRTMEEAGVSARRKPGRPAGKRRKAGWDAVTRRARPLRAADHLPKVAPTSSDAQQPQDAATVAETATDSMETIASAQKPAASMLELIAEAFWATNLEPLFDAEIAENERLCGPASALPPSSYRRRLRDDAALKYDRRRRNQRRDEMAVMLHCNNQRHWSPSLLARSIAYYGKGSRFVQRNETNQRRIASKPTVRRVLKMMMERKPRPIWKQGVHVKCFGYDQTYQWIGVKKRGRRQSVERVDSAGMPLEIKHMVYINSIDVALPQRLGSLSAADLQRIAANHGSAYTEPYNNILVPLLPDNVELSLVDFVRDVCASVDQVCGMALARIGGQAQGNEHVCKRTNHMLTCRCGLFGRKHFLLALTSQL